MEGAGGQPTFAGPASGATMQAQYMGRTMKCYPVHESELETLATLNTEATIFTSVGSASLAFAIGIWTNAAFAETLTPLAQLTSKLGAPVLVFVAVVFYALAVYAALRRRSLWARIKSEAVNLQASAVP